MTFQTKILNVTIGNSIDDRQHKKVFKRKMKADKVFLQTWSENN